MFTAFELVNTVKFMAVTFVETGHVITILLAFTPTFGVEWNSNIFIVTVFITAGMIRWMATSCLFDVVQKWLQGVSRSCSDAIHVKAFWTQSPDIKSEKKKENKNKLSLKLFGFLIFWVYYFWRNSRRNISFCPHLAIRNWRFGQVFIFTGFSFFFLRNVYQNLILWYLSLSFQSISLSEVCSRWAIGCFQLVINPFKVETRHNVRIVVLRHHLWNFFQEELGSPIQRAWPVCIYTSWRLTGVTRLRSITASSFFKASNSFISGFVWTPPESP